MKGKKSDKEISIDFSKLPGNYKKDSFRITYTTKAPEASDKSVDVKNSVDFHDSTHHYSDSTSVTKRWWIINTTSAFSPATTMGPPAIRFAAAWSRLRDNDLRERKLCFRSFFNKT